MIGIQLVSYGDPKRGIVSSELPEPPAPKDGEALVEMMLAPIGMTDLFLAEGHFGTGLPVPSVIGGEGLGIVRQVGPGVESVRVGERVLVPAPTFTWAQRVVAPAAGLVVVPPDVDPAQASMLAINPPTASLLLSEFTTLAPGDWVVQNAGNSGVGRWVSAFARHRGLRTISIVRRKELVDELKAAGADAVLPSEGDVVANALEAAGGGNIALAIDGVGGGASEPLSRMLSANGRLVTYVATNEPLAVDAGKLIFNNLQIGGFFIYRPQYAEKLKAARTEAISVLREQKVKIPVVARYPAREIGQAVARALEGGRVLLDFSE